MADLGYIVAKTAVDNSELEASVDVMALLREGENQDTVIAQADFAARVLEGVKAEPAPQSPAPEELLAPPPMRPGHPTLEQVMNRIAGIGIDIDHFSRYADERWGCGWKINPQLTMQRMLPFPRHGHRLLPIDICGSGRKQDGDMKSPCPGGIIPCMIRPGCSP